MKAKNRLCTVASNVMFAILNRCRNRGLDIDTQLYLFNTIVVHILTYGSEVWGYGDITVIERIQLRFFKLLLNIKKSTPNVMVRGELGEYPLGIRIKM